MLILAHPYTRGVDKVHYCLTEQEQQDVTRGVDLGERSVSIGEGNMEANHLEEIKQKVSLTEEQENSIKKVYTTSYYIGLVVEPKPGKIRAKCDGFSVFDGYDF